INLRLARKSVAVMAHSSTATYAARDTSFAGGRAPSLRWRPMSWKDAARSTRPSSFAERWNSETLEKYYSRLDQNSRPLWPDDAWLGPNCSIRGSQRYTDIRAPVLAIYAFEPVSGPDGTPARVAVEKRKDEARSSGGISSRRTFRPRGSIAQCES